MHVLIVYAHHESRSLNASLKDIARDTLVTVEHTVEISDLYAMGFNPVAGPGDVIGGVGPEDGYSYAGATQRACAEGRLAPDILVEHEKLRRADLVILQFPIYWFSVPAILKGWFDRVLTKGFAYGRGHWYDTGGLRGKRAMLSLTLGGPETMYGVDGINGAIDLVLWPIHNGVLRFSGFDVLRPQLFYSAYLNDPAFRGRQIDAYRARLAAIANETPMAFLPLAAFDDGFRYKDREQAIVVGPRPWQRLAASAADPGDR